LTGVKGALVGVTSLGGAYGLPGGVIFSINPKSAEEKVLYSFNGGSGEGPESGLLYRGGILYGTTVEGGYEGCDFGCGTVFSFDRKTRTETVLHDFGENGDGSWPQAGVVALKGKLYGTTSLGGAQNCYETGCGVVFSLDPATGAETVLHSFCERQDCPDGGQPFAGLTEVNGLLYGTTEVGGKSKCADNGDGCGTAFVVDPATRTEMVVYSFCSRPDCVDGEAPLSGLLDVNGVLYGTTASGGAGSCYAGCGTIYKIVP
jgi:uncharacterized repeat protein (TIGR03803 family)